MSDQPQQKPQRKIPPLVWIVVAAFVIWGVVIASKWDTTRTTPSGEPIAQDRPDETLVVEAPETPRPPVDKRGLTGNEAVPDTPAEAARMGQAPGVAADPSAQRSQGMTPAQTDPRPAEPR